MTGLPLSGRQVVVTRPAGQAGHLAGLIRAAGGEPVLFPALEIRDIEDPRQLLALIERLDEFDLAVFVSANAVSKALDFVNARRAWPGRLGVATVGRGTERVLGRYGFSAVIVPKIGFDSEALLDLPELNAVAGKRVVIFRGGSGRELLGETLVARGATVEHAECYRRCRPQADAAPLLELWVQRGIDALTVSSSEGLANLSQMLDAAGRRCLVETPLFAPHERIAAAARKLGVRTVVLTGSGDEGLIEGMSAFFAKV